MNIDSTGPFFKASKAPAPAGKASATAAVAMPSLAAAAPASAATAGAIASLVRSTSAAAQLASTHADFDAAKVAEIRASISAGLYKVNTGCIADGLLASAQELLQSPRS